MYAAVKMTGGLISASRCSVLSSDLSRTGVSWWIKLRVITFHASSAMWQQTPGGRRGFNVSIPKWLERICLFHRSSSSRSGLIWTLSASASTLFVVHAAANITGFGCLIWQTHVCGGGERRRALVRCLGNYLCDASTKSSAVELVWGEESSGGIELCKKL